MAELKRDRVRAAKLRGRKKLRPEDAKWLRDYDTRVAMAKANKARAMPDARVRPASTPRTVRGPQLSLVPGPADKPAPTEAPTPSAAVVHETVPVDGSVAPDAATWNPVVPAAGEGTEPPSPGAPPPPVAGAPLVDEVQPQAAAAPQGDPAGAAQFAGLVMWITRIGIKSALMLADELDMSALPLPPEAIAAAHSTQLHGELLQEVGAAAYRMALARGFKHIPMADEAVVLVAVGGSVAATAFAVKKRFAPPKHRPAASAASPQSSTVTPPEASKAPPAAGLAATLFGDS
jgi:hypothetical protein